MLMFRSKHALGGACLLLFTTSQLGCEGTRDTDSLPEGSGGASEGDDSGTGGEDADPGGDDENDSGEDEGGLLLDVGDGEERPDTPGGNPVGCDQIDFLFVVDNSGSMRDEQENLAKSFPGFIEAIQNDVQATDYHVMVVDSDAASGSINVSCSPSPDCCVEWCERDPSVTCNGIPCSPPESRCEGELGAGKINGEDGQSCGILGEQRYMIDGQPDMAPTFGCAAQVGITGDGTERPMEAMARAVTSLNEPGECNEGFLRPNAVLVVTFITDEDDDGKSAGDVQIWKDALVQAKGGNENAVVILGLVGDTDIEGSICGTGDHGHAEAAPNLRHFTDSFTYGSWVSVCERNYTPFFLSSVGVIAEACDDFVPQG